MVLPEAAILSTPRSPLSTPHTKPKNKKIRRSSPRSSLCPERHTKKANKTGTLFPHKTVSLSCRFCVAVLARYASGAGGGGPVGSGVI